MTTLNRRTLPQSAASASGICTLTMPSPGYAADPSQIGCVVPLNSSGQQYHYSLQMFFHQPNYDALIDCVPTCADAAHPAACAPATSGPHRLRKLFKANAFEATPA